MAAATASRGAPASPSAASWVLPSSVLLGVVVVAGVELLRVPLGLYASSPLQLLRLPPLALAYALLCLVPMLPALALSTWALWRPSRARRPGRVRVVEAGAFALLSAGAAYAIVLQESSFLGYLPLLVSFAAAGAGLGVAMRWLARRVDGGTGERRLRLVAVLGLAGFAVSHAANVLYFRGAYPTLHLGVLQVSFVTLVVALAALQLAAARAPAWVPRLAGLVAALSLLAAAGTASGRLDAGRPYLFGYTLLGQSRILLARWAPPERGRGTRAVVPDGVARFVEHSGMPRLPEGLSLLDYNVLLITCEAVRQDQTSLHAPELGTTPRLLQLSEEPGVTSFTRAYSPSSATVQSIVSLFTMTFPSAAAWQGWKKPWHGELLQENVTVPEHFALAGYSTFWVGHNYLDLFGEGILGFDQGFHYRHLVHSERDTDTTDDRIVRTAIKRLHKVARGKKPFFGWVFLVSPHSHYMQHDPKAPADEDIDRYRQELRYVDGQVARLLSEIDRLGVAGRTIVIFLGDHGEEFKEHGARGHSRALYSESTHVPLLVRVPGMEGTRVDAPVSLTYLFPWLLLRGDARMQLAAEHRMRRDLGLMRQATGGAVVMELLGTELMKSSLVYPRYRIDYDHFSGLHELFDLEQDPLEQENLFETDPSLASDYAARMHRYRTLRSQLARYSIDPERGR